MRYVRLSLGLLIFGLLLPSVSSAADETFQDRINKRVKECWLDSPAATITTGAAVLDNNVTVGMTATAQLLRFNLSSGKASVNTPGLGAGVAFRYYPDGWIENGTTKKPKDIRYIRSDCRATTFDALTFEENPEKARVAFPLVSIIPTVFVSKDEKTSEVTVDPALVAGFFRDIVTVGVGVKTTGPDRGKPFLLFGLGAGFKF